VERGWLSAQSGLTGQSHADGFSSGSGRPHRPFNLYLHSRETQTAFLLDFSVFLRILDHTDGGGSGGTRIYFGAIPCYNIRVLNTAAIWKNLNSPRRLFLIAGPCVIENEQLCRQVAASLVKTCRELGIFYIFKASFDKANRTSAKGFRGPGIEAGLKTLAGIREEFGVPVLTDVHTETQAALAGGVVDVLQIPAFLCRQTDLIEAAVATGKIVNLKKGQFLSPAEMGRVAEKARLAGGRQLLLTERGTTFGYNNLVVDMRSIPILKTFGAPVVFDATHSVQLPGGGGDKSAGQREFAPMLARAALAAGADGLFIETHPHPAQALSDGPNMIPLGEMNATLKSLLKVFRAVR
jgi:2-dehydro-3-deoxyphosphooctonate aldolase (KDO 8-P synthase)